ncbi:MAG: 50S ribosomal protein L5 [Candidatus Omnitrophica bacterium CG11_big_fil_rev_8_21_14_0_20_64_10]|nr:MAG: 50S ribosomal protein L5 [Candidatus Omnitrophica bacterium CG11_big_fil_rev_8_21_14_0_20_64_10]
MVSAETPKKGAAKAAPRLLQRYRSEVAPALRKQFGYKNPHQVPRLTKVVVHMGVGAAVQDEKILHKAAEELGQITGQKPILTRARKAVSNFKLKAGQAIGAKVTLRRAVMYEFVDRLFNIAMPRIRDFRGVLATRGFDGQGNFSLGITEQLIFPEIEYDKVTRTQGMHITFCTSAANPEEARALLKGLGMPFREASRQTAGSA